MTEKDLQDFLRKECLANGAFFAKLESKSSRGFPDCMIAKNGHVIFVELKSPKKTGRLHALQKRVIEKLQCVGLDVRIVDSKNAATDAVVDLVIR